MNVPTLEEIAKQIAAVRMLQSHSDKNFVQRLLNPYIFPVMRDVLTEGDVGTHLMSSGTADDQPIVYPEIVQDPKTGELRRLGRKEASRYALDTGEYIPFSTSEEAEDFGANYKKYLNIWR